MRTIGAWAGVAILLVAASCGPKADEPDGPAAPVVDAFKGWPSDNVARPAYAGAVERQAPAADGRTCFFMVPDWCEPTDAFAFKGPKGATIWFAFAKRDSELAKDDDARIAKLLADGNKANQTLVIARPWRGWYGESDTAKGRLRVYSLFSKTDSLEVHLEWPRKDPTARAEAEEMATNVIYSVKALGKGD